MGRVTENTETKPGIFTTEFWLTAVTNVVLLLDMLGTDWLADLPDRYEAFALMAVNGLYALSRGIAKQGQPHYGPAPSPDLDDSELQPGDLDVPEPEQTPTPVPLGAGATRTGPSSVSVGPAPEAPQPEGALAGKPEPIPSVTAPTAGVPTARPGGRRKPR